MQKGFVNYIWIAAVVVTSWVAAAHAVTEVSELALNEAIALALEQHCDVRQAELELQIAELELEAAWARSTVPSIGLQVNPPDLSMGGFAEDIEGAFGVGVSLPWGTQTSLSADLRLGWNRTTGEWDTPAWGITYSQRLDLAQLDAGSEELSARQQAVTGAEAALEQARNTVVLDTIEAYSDLLSTRALLVQAKADLQQAEANLARMEEQVEAGIKGETSLLEAELGVLDAQITLEQAETAYATDKETFGRVTLGISEDCEPATFELPLGDLTAAAAEMVIEAQIPEQAILDTSEVQAAEEKVTTAKEALRAARVDPLPELSIQAGIDEAGWKISWGVSIDLFEPDRFVEIDIAAANLELAEAQLDTAEERVKNNILNRQASLKKALDDLERLPLEKEKWTLEETVKREKLKEGLLSTEQWNDFQEEKNRFHLTANEREVSLLLAYFRYRDSLGLDLNWEEWMQ